MHAQCLQGVAIDQKQQQQQQQQQPPGYNNYMYQNYSNEAQQQQQKVRHMSGYQIKAFSHHHLSMYKKHFASETI